MQQLQQLNLNQIDNQISNIFLKRYSISNQIEFNLLIEQFFKLSDYKSLELRYFKKLLNSELWSINHQRAYRYLKECSLLSRNDFKITIKETVNLKPFKSDYGNYTHSYYRTKNNTEFIYQGA